jgi:lipid-binding SYLF domain-containing protein
MSTNATHALINPTIDLGGEAQGTAGNNSSTAEGKIVSSLKSVLVYSDRNGFYAGAAMKAGSIAPDDKANQVYYGQYESMSDILFDKKLESTEAATELAKQIKTYSEK